MIARENRALSEWVRDRLKRTGIGSRLPIPELFKLSYDVILHPFTVLLLRALIHEFARVSRAIIHAAVKLEKTTRPLI